jgi:putative SOS response-associated peptidase YedK
MCGRFVLFSDLKHIQLAFDLADIKAKIEPSYNIAPTHQVATIVQRADEKSLELMRWGLIPSWAKDDKLGAKMINARAETVAEKPSFKRALIKRRCLVIADGFYEWRKEGTRKTPMFIRLKSGELLGFAGLYETWKSPAGETITSCTIITTAANELMQSIHERMPVILSKEDQRAWLDPANQDALPLVALLQPYPSDEMQAYAVSPLVNSPRNNSAECIKPV